MQQKTITKQFSQFIDKRFYFSDDITSLTLSHPYLQDLNGCKQKKGQRIPNVHILVYSPSIRRRNSTWKVRRN